MQFIREELSASRQPQAKLSLIGHCASSQFGCFLSSLLSCLLPPPDPYVHGFLGLFEGQEILIEHQKVPGASAIVLCEAHFPY